MTEQVNGLSSIGLGVIAGLIGIGFVFYLARKILRKEGMPCPLLTPAAGWFAAGYPREQTFP